VIDLKASPPAVIATLQAGKGAAGVSINRAGTLALVANRNEGTVSVFTIAGKTLTPAGKIDFGDAKSGPCLAAFTPDGKMALVTRDGDHKISILSVDGDKVTDTKKFMVGGYRPYSVEISAKGDIAVVGNQGGGQGDADVINVIDLKSTPPRVVDTISVGQTPEGVAMSRDGAYVAITVMNGSNRAKDHPAYNDFGLVQVYSIDGIKLAKVAEAKVGHWCQGAAWSKDNKTVAVQCMVEKNLQAFAFDGKTLTPSGTAALSGGGAGLRTAEQ
jgi:DNA-binding beta-propeller fold protein YncE